MRTAPLGDRERFGLGAPVMTPPSRTTAPGKASPGAGREAARERVAAAVEVLAQDGCVALPTETVWGLATSARSPDAVAALRNWKGRSDAQPISVLVSGLPVLDGYGFEVDRLARKLMERFWPGPLTLVLPCRSTLAPGIARADGAVGVRCSSHPVVAELVAAAEAVGLGPLTATSCNRSGESPARDEAQARALCAGRGGPHVLGAGSQDAGATAPTTVLDLAAQPPRILREGRVSEAMLRPIIEEMREQSAPGPTGSPTGETTG